MSTSPDSEITIDPSSDEISREISEVMGNNPSSEEISSVSEVIASPDSEILIDNPSSDEVSREISEVMRNIPSSEEVSSVSEAAGYETASEGLAATGVDDPQSPSSEEIPSQHSTATIPPEVLAILAESPDGFIIPPEIRQSLPGKFRAVGIPPDGSGEETDDSGQRKYTEVFEKAMRSDESSPSQEMALSPDTTEKVGFFKRVWLQKDPWKLHLKKYWLFFLMSYLAGIIGLVLFGFRFAPLPYINSLEFLICSAALLELRCILMHLVIPEGPPFTATETGAPVYEAKGTA